MSTLLASGHVLIGANISPAMAGMAKVNAQFARTGTSMGRTGSAMTKAIGLPIAAAFAYSIKAAADFESALNNMQAVSGGLAVPAGEAFSPGVEQGGGNLPVRGV